MMTKKMRGISFNLPNMEYWILTFSSVLDILALVSGQHRNRIALVGGIKRTGMVRKHHIEAIELELDKINKKRTAERRSYY